MKMNYIMGKDKVIFFIIGLILFLISPLFALPFIIALVYENKRGSLLLLSMFLGYISYMIFPTKQMDLARYYEYYELISTFSKEDFLLYLSHRPDKLFYSFMFLFSRLELKFQFFLFLFSTFNYYVVFSLFKTIFQNQKLNKQKCFTAVLFLVMSFGFLNYFASSRFTIALSFFILSVKAFFLSSKKKMIIFYILSILTHTSFFVFAPLFFILKWIKSKRTIIGLILFLTIILAIIPKDSIISIFSFNESFASKAMVYAEAEERKTSLFPLVSYFLFLFVSVIAYFKLPKLKIASQFSSKILFVFSLGLLSIFIMLPQGYIVVDRFFIIFKSIFTILLFYLFYFYQIDKTNSMRTLLFLSFFIYVWYSFIIYSGTFSNILSIDYLFTKDILNLEYNSNMFR